MHYDDIKLMLTTVVVFFAGAALWYQVWIKPRDQFMYAVIDCMNQIDDHSEGAYVFCGRNARAALDEKR